LKMTTEKQLYMIYKEYSLNNVCHLNGYPTQPRPKSATN